MQMARDWLNDLVNLSTESDAFVRSGITGDAFAVYSWLRVTEQRDDDGNVYGIIEASKTLPLSNDQIVNALNNLKVVGWIYGYELVAANVMLAFVGKPHDRMAHLIDYAFDEWMSEQLAGSSHDQTVQQPKITLAPSQSRLDKLKAGIQAGHESFNEAAATRAAKLAASHQKRSQRVLETGSWATTGPMPERTRKVSVIDVVSRYVELIKEHIGSVPPAASDPKKTTAMFKTWCGEYGADKVLEVLNEIIPEWDEIQKIMRTSSQPIPQVLLNYRHQLSTQKNGSVIEMLKDVKGKSRADEKKESMNRDEWQGEAKGKESDPDTGW
jgi:hypothetical protein